MINGRKYLHPKVYESLLKEVYNVFKRTRKGNDILPSIGTFGYATDLLAALQAHPKAGAYIRMKLNNNFSTKNFICERSKSWKNKTFDMKRVHVYVLYIGYDTLIDFLSTSDYFQSEDGQRIQREQRELFNEKIILKDKKELIYNYYAFHLVSDKLQRYELKIEYDDSISKRNFQGKAVLYNDKHKYRGTINFVGEHLHIFFPRKAKTKLTWQPYSLLFFIQEKAEFETIPVLIGTYSAISVISKNALAGEGVLCKKELAGKFEHAIKRHLYLNQYEISIPLLSSAQARGEAGVLKVLKTKNISWGLMEGLVGKYEAFGMFNDYKALYRFNVEIFEDFSSRLWSEDYAYWGVIEKGESTIIICNWKEKKHEFQEEYVEYVKKMDNMIVLKTSPIEVFRDTGHYVYEASFAADSQIHTNISHNIFLLRVDEMYPPKSWKYEKVVDFLEERQEYEYILQQLIKTDEKRIEVLAPYKKAYKQALENR